MSSEHCACFYPWSPGSGDLHTPDNGEMVTPVLLVWRCWLMSFSHRHIFFTTVIMINTANNALILQFFKSNSVIMAQNFTSQLRQINIVWSWGCVQLKCISLFAHHETMRHHDHQPRRLATCTVIMYSLYFQSGLIACQGNPQSTWASNVMEYLLQVGRKQPHCRRHNQKLAVFTIGCWYLSVMSGAAQHFSLFWQQWPITLLLDASHLIEAWRETCVGS